MTRGPYHKTEKPVTRRIQWVESYLCEGTYTGRVEELREKVLVGALRPEERQRLKNTKIEVKRAESD